MPKRLKYVLIISSISILCVGCLKKETSKKEQADVQVETDGKILVKYEETLDKDYYNEKELESLIDSEVKEFNELYGKGSLEKDSFKVKKDVATLWYSFVGADEYKLYVSDFMKSEKEVDMFEGTYEEAVKAGLKFDVDFKDAEESKNVKPDEFEDTENLRVLYTNEKYCVYVPGEIEYISDTVTLEKDVADTTADKDNYILYKLED